MRAKTLVLELIERERTYLDGLQTGSEEYNASLHRLNTLEEKLADIEKFESESVRKDKQMEDERKDQIIKNIIEGSKFVIGGVVIPIVGLVCITASEKDITFTGALREYTRLFIPKRLQ